MSKGVNRVMIIGNLGADPEVRFMPSGGAVANLRLATSESWKDKQTGQQHDRTEWHSVVLYNRIAEIAGEYLKKGSKTYIEGSLRTRKWQDKNGIDRYTTEIVGQEMQMLDSRGTNGVQQSHSEDVPPPYTQDEYTNNTSNRKSVALPTASDLDDEIPF